MQVRNFNPAKASFIEPQQAIVAIPSNRSEISIALNSIGIKITYKTYRTFLDSLTETKPAAPGVKKRR